MKYEQLIRKSIPAGPDLRVRLARPDDRDFLTQMSHLAGAGRDGERFDCPGYQDGIRAALASAGGYWRAMASGYNSTAGPDGRVFRGLGAAISIGTFDLVATKNGRRIGAVSVGDSYLVPSTIADQLGVPGQHQALSLLMALPKLTGLAVVEEERGHGYGADLLALTCKLLGRMGCVGFYGECVDADSLVGFYTRNGATVLGRGQSLNMCPVAGSHVVTKRLGNPAEGPFVTAEPGYRLLFSVAVAPDLNETQVAMKELNVPRTIVNAPYGPVTELGGVPERFMVGGLAVPLTDPRGPYGVKGAAPARAGRPQREPEGEPAGVLPRLWEHVRGLARRAG